MNIAGSTSIPLTMNTSILKSANKQPELALQLLQKSLEGITPSNSQVSSSQAASPTTPRASSRIDIRV
ncbi:MAG: hypothetical protein KKA76_03445 [Proteobacteria bacterium]|nr:hypothetical protein [Pseudomonadota bacterium]